jgi:hypothetical protein
MNKSLQQPLLSTPTLTGKDNRDHVSTLEKCKDVKINNSLEIKNILESNRLKDLKIFIQQRENLNCYNVYLIYIFHVVQSAGILTTSLAAGYNLKFLIWLGVSLNALATLITIFEKTNNSISDRLMENIQEIKKGNYIDELNLVNPDEEINRPISLIHGNEKV